MASTQITQQQALIAGASLIAVGALSYVLFFRENTTYDLVLKAMLKWKSFDTNNDGTVDEAEFIAGMEKCLSKKDYARIKAVLPDLYVRCVALRNELDTNGDGVISTSELVHGLRKKAGEFTASIANSAGMAGKKVRDEINRTSVMLRALNSWKDLDTDGDGNVTWDEFETGMKKQIKDAKLKPLDPYVLEEMYLTIQNIYLKYDVNNDLTLSFADVQEAARHYLKSGKKPTTDTESLLLSAVAKETKKRGTLSTHVVGGKTVYSTEDMAKLHDDIVKHIPRWTELEAYDPEGKRLAILKQLEKYTKQ